MPFSAFRHSGAPVLSSRRAEGVELNKLVAVLAATTAVSSAAALYWRHELIEERARHTQVEVPAPPPASPALAEASEPAKPAAVAPPAAMQPRPATPPARASTPAATASTRPIEVSSGGSSPWPLDETRKADMRQRAAQYLRKYDNPEGQKELREQALASTRRNLKGFDKEAGLDSLTFEKLIQLITDQEIERRVLQSRCMAEPPCDAPPPEYRELLDRQKAELANVIGREAAREMPQWMMSVGERRMTATLSGRLPANVTLSSSQSAALITALTAERRAISQEYAATRQRMAGYGNVDGSSAMYVTDAPTIDDRVASARVNSQRLRDRAATVLSGEQLTVFNQMQDELLFDLQRHLKRQESDRGGS